LRVNPFDNILFQSSASDIGLIRGDDEKKTGLFQFATCFSHTGEDDELVGRPWRIWFAIDHLASIDDAVSVEEDGNWLRPTHR
jgi:hypothetical protein